MKKLLVIFTILLTLIPLVMAQNGSEENTTPVLISEPPMEQENQEPPLEVQNEETIPEIEVTITNETTSLFGTTFRKILGGLVALIILITIVKIAKRTSPEKLYKKAEMLHREAKEFHEDGDNETSEELYEKAEEMRQNARDLANEV